MAPRVARNRTAGARAECADPRSLSSSGNHPLGPPARTAVPRQFGVASADGRFHSAGRRLHPYRRGRSGPHRTGRFSGAGRQCAYAIGRQLHVGKSRDDDGDVPRAVQPDERAPRLRLSALAGQQPCGLCTRRYPGQASAGGADAGHLQLGLFRTCLPRRSNGRGTGRRQRSARD